MHTDTATTGCAITGDAFYNPAPARFPVAYVGDYFFADLGSPYFLARRTGSVERIRHVGN